MNKKQRIILVGAIFVILLALLGFSMYNKTPSLPQKLTFEKYNSSTQTPIQSWKEYTNKEYGFSLKYPSVGYVQDNSGVHLTSCGSDIHQEKLGDTPMIGVDNYFNILIKKFDGTLAQYVAQNSGSITYLTEPVTVSGADEALFIKGQKESSDSIPEIMYPAYLIKKGDHIFSINNLQNPGSKTGCLPPAGTKGNIFDAKYWNIPQSITFQ